MIKIFFAVFGLCLFVAASADDTVAGDDQTTRDSKTTWSCPSNWVSYIDGTGGTCLWFGNETLTHPDAEDYCANLGGSLVRLENPKLKQYVLDAVLKEDGDFWIGLKKQRGYEQGFQWKDILANPLELPDQINDYLSYKEQCVFISSYAEEWELDDCDSEYNFVCQKTVECKAGAFGPKCDQECHCIGEPCNPLSDEVQCKWGCEQGWMGDACDKKKENPEVKYYCVNSHEEGKGKYAHVRIYTKGIEYKSIYGLTKNDTRGRWCYDTSFKYSSIPNELTMITLHVNDYNALQMEQGECVGEHVNGDIYSWTLVIKENEGILLQNDLQVYITCDFSSADELVRADDFAIDGDPVEVNKIAVYPETTDKDVLMELIDSYSGDPITKAQIGSSVVLRLKYGLQPESMLKGVLPYNCLAISSDGKHSKKLIDENGCSEDGSLVQPFAPGNGKYIQTPWFTLFAFEKAQSIKFQCSFQLCFQEGCSVGCRHSVYKRDTYNSERVPEQTTTRTIRVLPSITPQKNAKPENSGVNNKNIGSPSQQSSTTTEYQFGPLVYLNPVTFSLFLLLLVIFLIMYLTFLRTLRKSVDNIRKEIELKRSRDKFLHCGCTQQIKDREFVSITP